MKWQTKPNQFTIYHHDIYKARWITAIEIDPNSKTIKLIKIENNIDYIKKHCDFFKYDATGNILNSWDYFFLGLDEDRKKGKTLTIRIGNKQSKPIYGKVILAQIPKSGDLYKLKSTSKLPEDIKPMITFND